MQRTKVLNRTLTFCYTARAWIRICSEILCTDDYAEYHRFASTLRLHVITLEETKPVTLEISPKYVDLVIYVAKRMGYNVHTEFGDLSEWQRDAIDKAYAL